MTELTKTQVRQFILLKQGLLGGYRFSGKQGAYDYIRQAGCIQYDPVDVCGKNAELTLQSRVKGFQKSMLEELLYKDRLLVDYVDKELSIWPAEDWPYFSSFRKKSRAHGERFPGLKELEQEALSHIEKNGPVSSDTLPIGGEIFWHSSMHWSGNWHRKSKAARSVLEQLYTDGTLVIHHKNGSRKFYDLAVRCLDPELLETPSPCENREEFLCWRVLRRIGAVGLLWDRNSPAFLGLSMNAEERRRTIARLEGSGAILPARVEGIKALFYYRAEDDVLMKEVLSQNLGFKKRLEFLAPLDPLLWDKAMIASLFDFSYSWEIYTTKEKRKYGYYTLPILRGESFIGRIEAAADRKRGVLTVKNIWLEPGVRMTKKLQDLIGRTLKRFSSFNGCTAVEGMDETVTGCFLPRPFLRWNEDD
ncbi:MAG: YcaQ family DNA glycosylase [Lachnospiraceae bacterium]|nr:YcaQ family DNA glycosylase [Lachnospiraceae bacterium]